MDTTIQIGIFIFFSLPDPATLILGAEATDSLPVGSDTKPALLLTQSAQSTSHSQIFPPSELYQNLALRGSTLAGTPRHLLWQASSHENLVSISSPQNRAILLKRKTVF